MPIWSDLPASSGGAGHEMRLRGRLVLRTILTNPWQSQAEAAAPVSAVNRRLVAASPAQFRTNTKACAMPFIIIDAAGEPLHAPNGVRLEFYSRDVVASLLLPGERIEPIAAFSPEGIIRHADLPRPMF